MVPNTLGLDKHRNLTFDNLFNDFQLLSITKTYKSKSNTWKRKKQTSIFAPNISGNQHASNKVLYLKYT